MRFAVAVVAAFLALPAGSASALTMDEILARYVEARGGAAKIEAIKSLRATGKVVFGGGESAIEAAWGRLQKRPGMIRSEITLQGLTAVEAFDGQEGWSLSPFQGRRDAEKGSADDAREHGAATRTSRGRSSTGARRGTGSSTWAPRTWTARPRTSCA